MRAWAIAILLTGCGGDGGGQAGPRVGDMCDEDEAPQCGVPMGSEDETTIVVVCDAGVFVQGIACPPGELCFQEESRQAPACRDVNDITIYGEPDEPCLVNGSDACDFSQERTLLCQSGVWTRDDTCTTDGRMCQTLSDLDEGCADRNSCVVCAI